MSEPPDGSQEQADDRTIALQAKVARLEAEIAARREVEAELRASEERFRTLLHEVNDVVWTAAGDGSAMFYINPACERVYGLPGRAFVDNHELWLEVVHPEDVERVRQEAEILFEKGFLSQEYRIVRPDGEVRWLSDRKFVTRNEAGETIRMGGLATDITERMAAREEREEFVRELEAKNTELERFTYTVSHDLQSPLVTIAGFLAHLEKDIEQGDAAQVRQDLGHIQQATERMQRLIGELLELSQIGRPASSPEKVSLSEAAQSALAMVAGQIETAGVTVEIDEEMPVVLAHRLQLVQVIQNLVENAVKFRGDHPTPRIEIGVRRAADQVVVYVQDNGRGVDPAHHQRVFDLFQQLDAKAEGTGIGLTLVRRIIEVHGGSIWIESEGADRGSTFCFSLPSAPP